MSATNSFLLVRGRSVEDSETLVFTIKTVKRVEGLPDLNTTTDIYVPTNCLYSYNMLSKRVLEEFYNQSSHEVSEDFGTDSIFEYVRDNFVENITGKLLL